MRTEEQIQVDINKVSCDIEDLRIEYIEKAKALEKQEEKLCAELRKVRGELS
jgi:hypothetical protein